MRVPILALVLVLASATAAAADAPGAAPAVAAAAPAPAAAAAPAPAVAATPAPAAAATSAPAATTPRQRWGLVLSGGSARGIAHVGVLRALEERNLRPDVVTGTSMGAIIGALYACGYSAAGVERVVRDVDWIHLLFPRTDAFAWRGNVTPRPLLRLGLDRRGVRLPDAPLDDAELNWLLSDLLIEGSAASRGFDRLPIPFRAVATDVATLRPEVFASGSLARAVRASMSIPLVFPPVRMGGRMFVDGGFADNLPIAAALDMGATRVVAVDLSEDLQGPDTLASGPAVAYYLARLMLERHPPGTPGPADLLVRLRMPGYGGTDYSARDSLIALGYRGTAAVVGPWADSVGLPRAQGTAPEPRGPLPALTARVEWAGLHTLSPAAARAALGRLPRGAFSPTELRPALARLHRSALFESAWPVLDIREDSTVLRLEVRETSSREMTLAAAWSTDDRERIYARLALHAPLMPAVGLVELTGVRRRHGRAVHLNLEPHALGRGGSGPFLRAGYRESETRIFDHSRLVALPRTIRRETFAGAQLELPARQVAQLGVGVTHVGDADRARGELILVFRAEGRGAAHRLYEAEWVPGGRGYSRFGTWIDASWRVGAFTARPALHAAVVDGDAPPDALPGLGGPASLAGLRHDEWLGRRAAAAEFRLLYPIGNVFSLSAAVQAGVVRDAVSAPELLGRIQPAAGIGAELTTPFGPLRADLGLTSGGRARAEVMLGDRF